jgi:hypothetical protein
MRYSEGTEKEGQEIDFSNKSYVMVVDSKTGTADRYEEFPNSASRLDVKMALLNLMEDYQNLFINGLNILSEDRVIQPPQSQQYTNRYLSRLERSVARLDEWNSRSTTFHTTFPYSNRAQDENGVVDIDGCVPWVEGLIFIADVAGLTNEEMLRFT